MTWIRLGCPKGYKCHLSFASHSRVWSSCILFITAHDTCPGPQCGRFTVMIPAWARNLIKRVVYWEVVFKVVWDPFWLFWGNHSDCGTTLLIARVEKWYLYHFWIPIHSRDWPIAVVGWALGHSMKCRKFESWHNKLSASYSSYPFCRRWGWLLTWQGIIRLLIFLGSWGLGRY